MKYSQWKDIEVALIKRGYKKWTGALYGREDFDVSRLVKDGDKDLYQLIFRFWNFEKYVRGEGYAVDFVVMPIIDGRMDAICSPVTNNISHDIEFAEQFAKDYYEFVIEHLKKRV